MSKTTEFMFPKTMELTPKHVDAMHLIKLFVREFEKYKSDGTTTNLQHHLNRMKGVHKTCKNFGF